MPWFLVWLTNGPKHLMVSSKINLNGMKAVFRWLIFKPLVLCTALIIHSSPWLWALPPKIAPALAAALAAADLPAAAEAGEEEAAGKWLLLRPCLWAIKAVIFECLKTIIGIHSIYGYIIRPKKF